MWGGEEGRERRREGEEEGGRERRREGGRGGGRERRREGEEEGGREGEGDDYITVPNPTPNVPKRLVLVHWSTLKVNTIYK